MPLHIPPFLGRLTHLARQCYAGHGLPAQCPFCHAWPVWQQPGGICAACLTRYAQTHTRCLSCGLTLRQSNTACPACTRLPSPLRRCVAAVDYGYPWQQAVEALKYGQQPAWAGTMAQLLLQQPHCAELLQEADCMLPVPLAKPRLRERGYNQAWELGKALQWHSGIRRPCISTAVECLHAGTAQAQLPRQQRLQRSQQRYRIQPASQAALVGQCIVLVDDVMTTGATLFTLAELLLQAGAAQVDALVFARTPLV